MRDENHYYTYVLECSDKTYYTGITNNITRRLLEHSEAKDPRSYTARRLPVKLVYCEYSKYVNNAIAREKQLKGWVRDKKKAIVGGDIDELKRLSRRRKRFNTVEKTRSWMRKKFKRRNVLLSE